MPFAFRTSPSAAITILTAPPISSQISSSIDLIYNLADSLGTREKPQLNYEFNRKINITLK